MREKEIEKDSFKPLTPNTEKMTQNGLNMNAIGSIKIVRLLGDGKRKEYSHIILYSIVSVHIFTLILWKL